MNNLIKLIKSALRTLALAILLLASFFMAASGPVALALTKDDLHSIYNDSVWYRGGQSSFEDSIFCLGGPGGSGPLYGPFFPKVADTAALGEAIKSYITTTRPDSPLINLASAYVGYGQQYNVSPVLVLAITQKETSLGTAGYAQPPKYNIGNIRGGSDSTGFNSYSSYQAGLKAIFELISGPLYLGSPSNDTSVAQVIRTYAPPSDNNDTAGYIAFILDLMRKILGSLPEGSDPTNDQCTPPADSSPGTVNPDGYAFPIGPQKKSAGYNLPCGKYTCHWDGSPAADIIRPNIDGAPVYAITNGDIGRVNTAYGEVNGCASINLSSSLDGYQYWYGHLQNPLVKQGDKVVAGQKIAEVARSSFGSSCWGGTPHLHIDRGSPKGEPGGYECCRDPGLVTLIDKLWSELPN